MTNFFLCTLLSAGYVILYWMLGAIPAKKLNVNSIPCMCILGFLTYYSLFEVVALPMKLLRQKLSHLSLTWAAILFLLLLFVLVCRREILKNSLLPVWNYFGNRSFEAEEKREKQIALILILLFTAAFAFLIGKNRNFISPYDAAYYIGSPVSSTYSNTLDAMNVYTGQLTGRSYHYYLLNTDFLHSAIVFQLLNIHSLPERMYSFSMAMIVLFEMMLFLFGQEFFQNEPHKYRKTTVFMVFATLLIMEAYSLACVTHRFAYRTYEGKSIVSYLYMSLILLFCLRLYRKGENALSWWGLFFCSLSGVAFCNTALFIIPGMTGTTVFPYVFTEGLLQKQWKILWRFLLIMLPCAVWIVLYQIL